MARYKVHFCRLEGETKAEVLEIDADQSGNVLLCVPKERLKFIQRIPPG